MGREHIFRGIYPLAFYAHIVVHRKLGYLQACIVLVVSVSGAIMARNALAGPIAAVGLSCLAAATFSCMVAAVVKAAQRQFKEHQHWATRCFLLLCSPLLLRLISGFLIVSGNDTDIAYRWNAWLVG